MKGVGKRINVPMMPLRLSIERKDAEVDCMRLGGLNKSALLTFGDEKKKMWSERFTYT